MNAEMLVISLLCFHTRLCQARVCTYTYDEQYGGIFGNCKGRDLTSIPDDLPRSLVALDLSDNQISLLPTHVVESFKSMKYLNLNNNTITTINKSVFNGARNLKYLHIARNHLSNNNESVPHGLFQDLHSLHTLNIEKNDMRSYPDWVFPPLINLQELYIDSITDPYFGPGFRHLMNLNILQMDSHFLPGGGCITRRLKNDTFENLKGSPLGTLVLNNCYITSCHMDVFKPLTSLTRLYFSHNDIGFERALKLLHPFTNSSMKAIILNHVYVDRVPLLSDVTSRILTNMTMMFLKRICVKELSVRANRIIWIDIKPLIGSRFSDCIEKIDFSNNRLLGDATTFIFLNTFPKLKYLSVGNSKTCFTSKIATSSDHQSNVNIKHISISLPSNMEYLDITGTYTGHEHSVFKVTFLNTNSLHTVISCYNTWRYLVQIIGLENVTTVDMSGTNFIDMKGVLASFPGVRNLTLRDNNIEYPIVSTPANDILQNNVNLINIDLSLNKIRSFPHFAFPSMIRKINISNNELESISLKLEEFTSLTTLDLSFNLIGQINSEVRCSLDEAHDNQQLIVSLEGNPLLCGCKNMNFIQWLAHTPVILKSNRSFTCTEDDGTITGVEDAALKFVNINRRCNGFLILSLTISFLAVLITFLITSYFVSKNLTRFRNRALKIFGLSVEFLSQADFDYSAYVAYCNADIPFVYRRLKPALEKNNIRLFLKDREVLPGVDIADGIVAGINNSWKTILVVSQDFLNDPWSNFTINTAVYSMTDLIPDRIIVLLVDDVQGQDLPESLLNAIEEEFIVQEDDFSYRHDTLLRKIRLIGHF